MPKKHHAGLPAELKIHSDEVQWFFIENYYDGPISGLAIFKNQIVQFCCFQEDIPEHYIHVLHQLSADALSKAHHAKIKFETMVGTHWSFEMDGTPLAETYADELTAARYYEEARAEPVPVPQPGDKPMIAWFDVNN
jgi:hypothetical protein